jgi:nucleotide-binding universal stress UspA family protein
MADGGPIIVGTDGSERAERAVDRAGELGRALGVPVHVVSGYTPGSAGLWMAAAGGFAMAEVHEEGEKRIRAQDYVDRAQQRLANLGVTGESHVWLGEPAEVLVRLADEQGAQMIVVGNRGMPGAQRMLGSVPNSVSHHARCAVLIVPTD